MVEGYFDIIFVFIRNMTFPYPQKKEFSFKECRESGLKFWQCPPFQFSVMALVLLVLASIIILKYMIDFKTGLVIFFVFVVSMIMGAYIIIYNYRKKTS